MSIAAGATVIGVMRIAFALNDDARDETLTRCSGKDDVCQGE